MREPLLPIGPLMMEHRMIERMIAVMRRKSTQMASSGAADTNFVNAAIDFVRIYADRLHHGKEEGILFRVLATKSLEPAMRKTLDELLAEHVIGRDTLKRLASAEHSYVSGDKGALAVITSSIDTLCDFYPRHIQKEDKRFFLPAMRYLTQEEKGRMLTEEEDFDRNFVHARYADIVQGWEQQSSQVKTTPAQTQAREAARVAPPA